MSGVPCWLCRAETDGAADCSLCGAPQDPATRRAALDYLLREIEAWRAAGLMPGEACDRLIDMYLPSPPPPEAEIATGEFTPPPPPDVEPVVEPVAESFVEPVPAAESVPLEPAPAPNEVLDEAPPAAPTVADSPPVPFAVAPPSESPPGATTVASSLTAAPEASSKRSRDLSDLFSEKNIKLLLYLGVFVLAASVLLFIRSQWEAIPAGLKLAALVLLTLVSGGTGAWLHRATGLRWTGVSFLIFALATIPLDAYASHVFGLYRPERVVNLWIGSCAATLVFSALLASVLREKVFLHLAGHLATALFTLVLVERDLAFAWYPAVFMGYAVLHLGLDAGLAARSNRARPFVPSPFDVPPPLLQGVLAFLFASGALAGLEWFGPITDLQAGLAALLAVAGVEIFCRGTGWNLPLFLEGVFLAAAAAAFASRADLFLPARDLVVAALAWGVTGVMQGERGEIEGENRVRGRAASAAILALWALFCAVFRAAGLPSAENGVTFLLVAGLALFAAARKESVPLGTLALVIAGAGFHVLGAWLGTAPEWRPHARTVLTLLLLAASHRVLLPWFASSLRIAARLLLATALLGLLALLPHFTAPPGQAGGIAGFALLGLFLAADGLLAQRTPVLHAGLASGAVAILFLLARFDLGTAWLPAALFLYALVLGASRRMRGGLPAGHALTAESVWAHIGLITLLDAPGLVDAGRPVAVEAALVLFIASSLVHAPRSPWRWRIVVFAAWLLELVALRHLGVPWRWFPAATALPALAYAFSASRLPEPAGDASLLGARVLGLAALLGAVPLVFLARAGGFHPPLLSALAVLAALVLAPGVMPSRSVSSAAAGVIGCAFALALLDRFGVAARHAPLALSLGAGFLLAVEHEMEAERARGARAAAYGISIAAFLAALLLGASGIDTARAHAGETALVVIGLALARLSFREESASAGSLSALAVLAAYGFILRDNGIVVTSLPLAGFAAVLALRVVSVATKRVAEKLSGAWDSVAGIMVMLSGLLVVGTWGGVYGTKAGMGVLAALVGAADAALGYAARRRPVTWGRLLLLVSVLLTFAARWLKLPTAGQTVVHALYAAALFGALWKARSGGARDLPEPAMTAWFARAECVLALLLVVACRADSSGVSLHYTVVALLVLFGAWWLEDRIGGLDATPVVALFHVVFALYAGLADAGVARPNGAVVASLFGVGFAAAAWALRAREERRWSTAFTVFSLLLVSGEAWYGLTGGIEPWRGAILCAFACVPWFVLAWAARGAGVVAVSSCTALGALLLEAAIVRLSQHVGLESARLAFGILVGAPLMLGGAVLCRRHGREEMAPALSFFALVLPLAAFLAASASRTILAMVSLAAAAHYAGAAALFRSEWILYPALLALAQSYVLLLREMGVPLIRMPPYLLSYAAAKILVSGRRRTLHPLSLTGAVIPAVVIVSMFAGGSAYLGSETQTAILSTFIAAVAYGLAAYLKRERYYAVIASGCLLSSYYLFVHWMTWSAWEFYTVPPALFLLALARSERKESGLRANEWQGAGLFLLLVPSVVRSMVAENLGSALFLAFASLGALIAGIFERRKKAAAAGALGLVADVSIQAFRYIQFGALPKSVWGIAFGILLIGMGILFERRRLRLLDDLKGAWNATKRKFEGWE